MDSLVGYNKRIDNYTIYHHESDGESDCEDDFYNTYDEETAYDNYDSRGSSPLPTFEEEERSFSLLNIKTIKPFNNSLLDESPTAKTPVKTPTWWDKQKTIDEKDRVIGGVLNYGALLPPPAPKPVVVKQPPKPKKVVVKPAEMMKKSEEQQPTRLCLSVVKKTKCFHGKKCRFAHDYSNLKQCNFGEKCKKIVVVKTNPDGTIELKNKDGANCNFKHEKESFKSYLNRVPQQHTSPKNK